MQRHMFSGITALVCSIGGFLLIDGQFRAGVSSQAETIVLENTRLRRTLLREMQVSGTFDQAAAVQVGESAASSGENGIFKI